MNTRQAIKVYVVDDSAIVRQTLAMVLQGDPDLTLMGSAPNPLIAEPIIRQTRPDVLLLDIEMPGMDGLTFLRQIMAEHPIPTVICSTLTEHGSKIALDALAAGAIAVVAKPRLGLKQFLESSRHELLQTLKAAARARPRPLPPNGCLPQLQAAKAAPPVAGIHALAMNKPVVLGASTGGTQAIEAVLMALPRDCPGIVIVQHMPERFTAMYAQRLDAMCAIDVREAKDGDRVERGLALIAPGGKHLQLRKAGGQYWAVVADGPPVNRHKPSVDVLFQSAAECAGKDALAIILTGMGNDGARGMKLLHDRGARTIAQDEASCIVFGMPMEAIQLKAVDDVLPLSSVANAILQFDRRA
ncbi:MAG TPA: chemotaxis response regulator protein-glutamate methylesterase [Aquabacterium sp.]|uniref:protein-glutamate methylesterase/protein-glutamine glutaminase n=1 Tax=Aquabacterium sp. TaxID=1872578 RepID=UPI002E314B49|nr:chemotaxis response regulator protein-glutamate methylesterase [Aquabacterium sp.]HEX5357554.1 chemotaxis response regulator protein-glutamate methylesterase [Aquabacterium sp.]